MAQGFTRDTVRVPLYRYFLTGFKGAGRALPAFKVEYEALSGTSVGALSTAENDLAAPSIATVKQGDHIVVISSGTYLLNAGTLTMRLRVGSTIIADPANFSINAGAWRFTADLVCRGSVLISSCELISTGSSGSSAVVDNHRYRRNSTSPTLTTPTIKLTAQFSNSDGSHDVTQEAYTLLRYRRG